MALLDDWLNGNTFDILRDKVNAIVAAVNPFGGGTANQLLFKSSSSDFDVIWKDRIVSSSSGAIAYNTGWTNAGAGVDTKVSLDALGTVEIRFSLTITTGGTSAVGTLTDSSYWPLTIKRFTVSDFNGSEGASEICVLNISETGDITLVKQDIGGKPADRGSFIFSIRYSTLY